ncbi:DUF421 domain-containing protein [Bacillus marinisedimentorum]|uniref:DUF421 domain-containing protein n=1 Tax=Bacillus marinisedimentorum TaxID=1821260 RepID=UPI00087278F0|nr:DUF421 domain-containing protein [Bacillus marinisedimentorum]
MDFFEGQETLTTLEWALRAVIAFFFLVIVARVLGQRSISQLRLLDFVIALVIGNIIAHPLSDEQLGLKGSVVTTSVLVALYLVALFSILRWPAVRKLINSDPVIIVKNGEILKKGLNKARISIDVLLEELREEKVKDVKNVALALWESDGKISVFMDPQYDPVTPASMQKGAEPFDFPKTVIKEGKINDIELKQIQKDEGWLISELKKMHHTDVKNVLLATVDRNETLKVFLYR